MGTWIAQHFFNPAFVLPWGAALLSLPVIIHLINRMRYRRVRFAAMEFLLKSQQRNRRRLLLEQLLLLLLRMLAVAGIVVLISRLILDPNQMSVFRGAKAHHVVLLDDSGSMRDRWGETSAFNEGLEVVRRLVAEGARRPDTQTLTLLLLSNPDQPVFLQRDVNEPFVTEVETRLERLAPSHQALDLARGIDAAGKILAEERGGIRHLHVISDYRLADWSAQTAVAGAIRALDEADVSVNLVRTVGERHANLAVTDLTGDAHVAAAGVPLRLKVALKNFGERVAEDVRLAVLADGRKLPLSLVFTRIEAGQEVTREFDVKFETPKTHRLEVSLEGDALPQDNTRYLAVDVAPAHPILIIDGDPSSDEGSYVADALAADPGLTGFAPLIESVDFLRKQPLDRFQCIYLVNVPELPPDAIEPLSEFVRAGGGLAWFLGNTVNPSFYTASLYKEGKGLFPVPLGTSRREMVRDDPTNPGPDLTFADHPLFRVFQGQENPFIDSVRIDSWWPVAEDWVRGDNERNDGVTTLAALRNKQPLILEHRFGEGRIVTVLTSAGPLWNGWARNPSYVVFQLELQKHIARNDRTLERRVVGQPIEVTLNPANYLETVEIAAPDPTGERLTRLQAAPVAAEKTPEGAGGDGATRSPRSTPLVLRAHYAETDLPGIYLVRLLDQNQVPEEQPIAYNVPVTEGNLELAGTAQILNRLGDGVRVTIQEPGSLQWIEGRDAGQEIRKLLLFLIVGTLLVEQILSWRFSYHPTTAGVPA